MLARSAMCQGLVKTRMAYNGSRTTSLLVSLSLCLLIVASALGACASSPTTEPISATQPSMTQAPSTTPTLEAAVSPLQPTVEFPGQSPISTPGTGDSGIVPLVVPDEVPEPEPGKAAISGVLYTFMGEGPIPGTLFYLTPGRGDENRDPPSVLVGPREGQGDVRGDSNEKGWIALNDIPPGNYFLIVWAPYDWIVATESEFDDTPRLITLEPDQQLNLGVIYVSWP